MSKKNKKIKKAVEAVEAVEAVNKTPPISFTFSSLFAADYRLITILLIALSLLVYGQVYDFEFVWDDADVTNAIVRHLNNPFIVSPSWENFTRLFNQPYFGLYIPISYLLWGTLKSLAELLSLPLNSVLHLSNVVVHIANGLLVFTVLKQFVNNKWAVAIGVGFFLLHPIQVEAVAWVSEFRGLLATLFVLLSWYYYLKNRAGLSWLPLLFFVLAMLSKPSAVSLVLFVFLTNHFHYQFKFSENIRQTLPFAVLALIIAVITYKIQSTYDIDFDETVIAFWQRPFAWLDSIVFYLVKIIYPYHLGASYTLSPKFISAQWWFYPLALVPLALGVLLWFKRKTQPVIVFSLALFVAGFFTTSGFVNFNFQRVSLVADRYLYVAMIGIALFVAAVINGFTQDNLVGKHGKNNQARWSVGALFAIVLAGFASLSAFRQIPIWHNVATLWSHSIHYEITPSYANYGLGTYFNNIGISLIEAGKYQQAIDVFDKAINTYPKNASQGLGDIFYNKGVALLKLKAHQQAIDAFDKAINAYSKNNSKALGKAFTNKGVALFRLKEVQQALAAFNKAIEIDPKNKYAHKAKKDISPLLKK